MNCTEVFTLATKLKVPDLKMIAQDISLDDLNESNAFKTFVFAHRYDSEDFNEIKKMFPGTILADELVDKLEKVKKLIQGKNNLDCMLLYASKVQPERRVNGLQETIISSIGFFQILAQV